MDASKKPVPMTYRIFYPTSFDEINAENDNMDVCLTMDDGTSYTFVVFTPDNLKELMRKDGVPYVLPCAPFLVAEALTPENIERLVAELVERGETFLRMYGTDVI